MEIDQRCQIPNFAENSVELEEIEEDDDDEALSLSDLPLIHHQGKNTEQGEEIIEEALIHDDFDFCSLSKQSEMCAADELFFQGQILPLRHSISSERGSLHCSSRSVSRSESMDHFYSSQLISSRSSSISSSSGSSSATATATAVRHNSRSKLPPRNQFHSHPSPSPRISFSNNTQRTNGSRNSARKSSVWNVLRLGLVTTPPEIALHDLKTRNCNNFGSRNSTSSNGSSVSSGKPKKKARGLLGGCKCSLDAVDTVSSKVVVIKRSAIENVNVEEIKPAQKIKKKHMSHHRTFEWLKQLSVEVTSDES